MPTIEMKTELPGPKSRAIIERKERVVCDPLDLHVNAVIDHGFGAAVTDVDGNTMLDLSSGLGCLMVGHSHPKVVEAVQRQAAKFSHTDFSVVPYEVYVDLAERLVERVGPGRKVALFNSGAEAVENAVKFAKAATGRPAVICFEGAFHGRTLLTMSLTSRHTPYKRGFGPFAAEVYRVPFSYPYRDDDPSGRSALADVERAFTTVVDPSSVAAVIFEPVLGEGGYVVPGPEFLPGVQAFCRQHGIVTIADEIQSGFGRTGKFLAGEHFGLDPDIVILAKALAAGYPLSAVVGRAEIMDAPGPVGDRRHVRREPRRVRRRERGPRRDRGGGSDRARGGRRQGDPRPLGAARGRHPRGRRRPRPRVDDRRRDGGRPWHQGARRRIPRAAPGRDTAPRADHRVVRRLPQRPAAHAAARDHRRPVGRGVGRAGGLRARGAGDLTVDADERPVGEPVGTTPAKRPARAPLEGRFVTLVPVDPEAHAHGLFASSHDGSDEAARMWTYLAYGPWPDEAAMRTWLDLLPASEDPLFLTVIERSTGDPVGIVTFMSVDPAMRHLELGNIWYSPRAQRTRANTESVYLMLREAFEELGHRRVEWKCDALNARSRAAAERLGFTFEGIFRQHMIIKGRNRDTAWYSMLDHEWPAVRANLERWLDEDPPPSLRELNAALRS